eukprot:1691202-Rhodomonas_salina.1
MRYARRSFNHIAPQPFHPPITSHHTTSIDQPHNILHRITAIHPSHHTPHPIPSHPSFNHPHHTAS